MRTVVISDCWASGMGLRHCASNIVHLVYVVVSLVLLIALVDTQVCGAQHEHRARAQAWSGPRFGFTDVVVMRLTQSGAQRAWTSGRRRAQAEAI
jgi:hypothetical protein